MSDKYPEKVHNLTQLEQELAEAKSKIAALEKQLKERQSLGKPEDFFALVTKSYFQRIVEGCSDHLVLLDASGNTLYSNSVANMLGYSVQEYIELGFPALLHPEDLASGYAYWESVLASPNQVQTAVLRARHQQGHYIWTEVSAVNLLHDAEIGVVVANTRAISDRVRMEEALLQSEALFRNTFEQAAVGISHTGLDGQWLRVNQRLCEIVGYSKEELLQKTFQDLTHPEDRSPDLEYVRQVLRGEIQTYTVQKRYFHKNGSIVWVNLTVTLIRNAAGDPDHFVVVIEDITKLKVTEQALLASEKRYRQIVEAQDDAICRFTPDFGLTFVNQYYAQILFQMQPDELIGKNLLAYLPEPVRRTFVALNNSLTLEKPSLRTEIPIRDVDGSQRWIEWNHRAIFDEKGQPIEFQVVGRETTKRRQIEDAQREQRRVAEALRDSLGALTASFDVDKTMQEILKHAITVVPADAATILLIEGETLRVAYTHGIPPEHLEFLKNYRFSIKEPQFQKMVASRQPFVVADTTKSLEWIAFPHNAWIRSSVGMPLVIRNEVIGVLHVDSKTAHHFRPEDTATLQDFARHASLALEHAYYVDHLEERVKERTAELEAYAAEIHDLYNNAPCGYHSLDKDGYFVQINDTELKWLGYRREEVIGQLQFTDLCTAQSKASFASNFPLLKKQGWLNNLELELVHKDGTVLCMLVSVAAIYDAQGEFLQGRTTLYDITALKRAQETVRHQRDLLQLVIDTVPTAIVLKGEDGRFEMVNKHCAALYNRTPEELVGKNDSEVHPDPEEVVLFAAEDQFVRESGNALFLAEAEFSGHALQTNLIPLKNATGKVERILIVSHDITERKKVERALSEQRDFLNLIINHVPDLIMVKDGAGRFQLVNEHAAEVYGITASQMLGKSDADLNPNAEEVAFYRIKDRQALELGHSIFIPEEQILDRFYQTSKIPLSNSAGKFDRLLVVASDITEHKQAEALLEQALQKEKELSDLRSRFISMTSHEFRTPLTAILATAETLSSYRHKLSDEQIDKRLLKIQEQVNYLKTVMEDVLQLSRLQAQRNELTLTEFDLDLLCQQIIDELRSEFMTAYAVNYHCDPSLKRITLEKRLMRQVLSNLLSNAVKYSPKNTPIGLSVRKVDNNLVVQVSDQGIGIPEADLKHLFEPFYRAANVGSIAGTGLGLAIARESVECQGGKLGVESQEGKGTIFTVTIPFGQEKVV